MTSGSVQHVSVRKFLLILAEYHHLLLILSIKISKPLDVCLFVPSLLGNLRLVQSSDLLTAILTVSAIHAQPYQLQPKDRGAARENHQTVCKDKSYTSQMRPYMELLILCFQIFSLGSILQQELKI